MIILDCKYMNTIEKTHRYLKEKLSFSDYYGDNLDALWDELTSNEYNVIVLRNTEYLYINLGEYGKKVLNIFKNASKDFFKLVIESND